MSSAFYNLDAESSVLGIFVKNPDTAIQHSGQLVESDFYDESNQRIFRAIQQLVMGKRQYDIAVLAEEFKKLYGDDALAVNVLEHLRNALVNEFKLKEDIEIVKSASFRRSLFNTLKKAKDTLSDPSVSTSVVLDTTRQQLREMTTDGHEWMSMSDVLQATFANIERKFKGEEKSMPSGVKRLDALTSGFHRGELTIIGARPAVGKSAFAAHIAISSAQNGYKVAICSREMTDVQYGLRILSRGVSTDNTKLREGKLEDADWNEVVDAMSRYGGLPIDFMFATRYIEDLRMEVQNRVDEGKLDLLIIDYLQLMQTKKNYEADWQRIAYISKALKDMTTDYNIPIIALAQVGRSAQNSMPSLAELRGSGDIEQDADNVIFIHRPVSSKDEYVRPEHKELVEQLLESDERQYIVLNIAKQRQGDIGSVATLFNPSRMRYETIMEG